MGSSLDPPDITYIVHQVETVKLELVLLSVYSKSGPGDLTGSKLQSKVRIDGRVSRKIWR